MLQIPNPSAIAQIQLEIHRGPFADRTPPIPRNTQVIAVASSSVFSCVEGFIAATRLSRLPVGSQRRRSAVSLGPYSPLVGRPLTQKLRKHSYPTRRPV